MSKRNTLPSHQNDSPMKKLFFKQIYNKNKERPESLLANPFIVFAENIATMLRQLPVTELEKDKISSMVTNAKINYLERMEERQAYLMQEVEPQNKIVYTQNVRHSESESKLKKTSSCANLSNLIKAEVEEPKEEQRQKNQEDPSEKPSASKKLKKKTSFVRLPSFVEPKEEERHSHVEPKEEQRQKSQEDQSEKPSASNNLKKKTSFVNISHFIKPKVHKSQSSKDDQSEKLSVSSKKSGKSSLKPRVSAKPSLTNLQGAKAKRTTTEAKQAKSRGKSKNASSNLPASIKTKMKNKK